ncbi:hypothetical protein FORC31_1880 [Escherichia coli]|nr:hypothetical protein FORC31_1880 [Escherichia coli]EMX23970.1 hypothetical protein ECMP0215661_2789 [Escherichia coli MP021566.1]
MQTSNEPSPCDSEASICHDKRREMMQWWADWIDEKVE